MKPLACEVDLPGTLTFLRRMVEVNSFTANPAGVDRVGAIIAEQFAALDFRPERVPAGRAGVGNHLFLRNEVRRERPTIALISHLDTVFPEEEERRNDFCWREEGGRIHGPGTNDIKGGTALMWMLLSALRRERPHVFEDANWVLAFNACEEVDSEDFGGACQRLLPADTRACLLFEADGGAMGGFKIVNRRKGRATFEVRVEGRGAHAGSQHARGVNAIVELAGVVGSLAKLTNYDSGVTVNVGTISGGTVNNRVPHEATATLEMRAWTTESYDAARAAILAHARTGEATVSVSVIDETQPWPVNEASMRLAELWQNAGARLGIPVAIQSRGGLSDGNVLWPFFSTLDGLGPCGDFAHCSESGEGKTQEYVVPESFVPKVRLNAEAIEALLRKE